MKFTEKNRMMLSAIKIAITGMTPTEVEQEQANGSTVRLVINYIWTRFCDLYLMDAITFDNERDRLAKLYRNTSTRPKYTIEADRFCRRLWFSKNLRMRFYCEYGTELVSSGLDRSKGIKLLLKSASYGNEFAYRKLGRVSLVEMSKRQQKLYARLENKFMNDEKETTL